MNTPQLPISTAHYTDELALAIDTMVAQRHCVVPGLFAPELMSALHSELLEHVHRDGLQEAKVGQGEQLLRMESIRGDEIRWLNGETPAQATFLAIMEEYRLMLNRQLFLGLVELEAHFAHYPPGTGYVTHLDSFENNNQRRITIVVYLNPAWDETDGGELQIMDDGEVRLSVAPLSGTLVTFVSEEVEHQVATTQRDRYSIAGWFRVRDPNLL